MNERGWKKEEAQSTNHPAQDHINDVRQHRIFEFGGSNTASTARMTRAPTNSATNSNAASNKTSKSISRRAISSSRISSRIGPLPYYTWKQSRLSDCVNQCLVNYGGPMSECPRLFDAVSFLLLAQFFHHRLQQLLGVRQLHRNNPQVHRRHHWISITRAVHPVLPYKHQRIRQPI